MGMEEQVRSPAVQHGEEADFSPEVLGIGSDGAQGFGGGTEEEAVDRLFVLIGEGGNLFRHREDDVEILGFQKFGLPVFQPLGAGEGLALGTVSVGTGVIGRALVAAAVTLLQMTTQSGRAAEFDV